MTLGIVARIATTLALVGTMALGAAPAFAQPYPNKPIRFIVPYPPGGNTDIVARLYAQKLAERLGQPVVIDNRGGAAGALGVGLATKAPNDGYTIVVGDLGSLVIAPLANPGVGYTYRDLVPVGLMSTVSIVVSANPKSPDNSIGDFLARAKAQPGKLTYGTSGIGAPSHLAMEYLRSMTGVDILHVPFKGGAQAVTGLLGEQVDIVVDGAAMAQVKAGKLKALAVTGPRLPALPDVAGIGETVKGFEFTNWWGVLAPNGTPADVVKRINDELVVIAKMDDVRDRLRDLGLAAQSGPPQQLADLLRTESDKVNRIVKDAGIKLE
jgi:tripartite-type tricarboxylate transporter receptor subunit TctC